MLREQRKCRMDNKDKEDQLSYTDHGIGTRTCGAGWDYRNSEIRQKPRVSHSERIRTRLASKCGPRNFRG